MTTEINRYSNYVFINKKIARNRVVIPPMASQTANTNGFVTQATIDHYKRLALSKAGLIFVEYSYVHPSGKGEANQLGADSDEKIEGLKSIAQTIHNSRSLAGLQLVHVGGKTKTILTGSALMAPSAIAVPVKGWSPEIPVAMTETEIENWVEWFKAAAVRASLAGFDFVELHAAHGYGLNQWLSSITNQRKDQYGGNIENRSRLLLKIVKEIKNLIPEILLAVRLPAQDHIPEGLNLKEMSCVAIELQNAGVDLIDVSSGIGGWRRPAGSYEEGYLVNDATELKSKITIPVIGVGGIQTGEFIDNIIKNKKVDFAAVGRAILSDPSSWSEKNLEKTLPY